MMWIISSASINIPTNEKKASFKTDSNPEIFHYIYTEGLSPGMYSFLKKIQ